MHTVSFFCPNSKASISPTRRPELLRNLAKIMFTTHNLFRFLKATVNILDILDILAGFKINFNIKSTTNIFVSLSY